MDASVSNDTLPIGPTPKQKSKSNRRKLLLTFLILLLTLLISVVAVFAYITADFTITNNVSFRAQNVNAHVEVNTINAGEYVEIINNSFDIVATDPANTPYGISVPKQDFKGIGIDNAIVYITTITNTGDSPFSVMLSNMQELDNLTIITEFYKGTSLVTNGAIITKNQSIITRVYVLLNTPTDTQEEVVMTFNLDATEVI